MSVPFCDHSHALRHEATLEQHTAHNELWGDGIAWFFRIPGRAYHQVRAEKNEPYKGTTPRTVFCLRLIKIEFKRFDCRMYGLMESRIEDLVGVRLSSAHLPHFHGCITRLRILLPHPSVQYSNRPNQFYSHVASLCTGLLVICD
jgi:hypothetical protein